MSHAIEVELKQIEDQLKRLRRREEELLQDQDRFSAAAIARNSRGSYDRWLANSLQTARVRFLAQNRAWQQQLREEQEQLRQLQGSWELQQRPHIFFPYMEKLLQYYQRNQEEQQQQQEQQQRGTKRKLCSESSSSSSDAGSESDGDAPSDNPTAKSAGGDVSNVDLTNAVTRVDALCVDPKNVDLSNGGDASRVDLANAAVPTP